MMLTDEGSGDIQAVRENAQQLPRRIPGIIGGSFRAGVHPKLLEDGVELAAEPFEIGENC
jgi:hypothetical protein